jgi:nucleotide-binding universal stress UspA family protein
MDELVVGLDGSDHSRRALRWAAAVARAAQVPVRAVQAWTYPRRAVFPGGGSPVPAEEMDERIRQDAAVIAAEVLGPSVEVKIDALRGPAAAAILQTVTPSSVLVLGSRGRGGFAGLLLGSVSQECVEYAPCPVVVVRTDRTLEAGDTILVGKDDSAGARHALGWAQTLAGTTGTTVHAAHAWQATVSERPPRVAERLRSHAAQTVETLTRQVGDEIETQEMEGDPRDVLVKAAERLDPALTVAGRRGAGGLRSTLLGSTANHLVRHAPTNVAVVPAPDAEITAGRGA